MNKKKMQYTLLLITCCIWGIFIYRIYMSYGSLGEVISDNSVSVMDDILTSTTNDTFLLVGDYRDPFLGQQKLKQNIVPILKPPPIIKPVKKEAPWPAISYEGMIRNQQNNKLLAALHVNGKNTMLVAGGTFEEVKVCRILKDSIEVMFGKEKKYVLK
jgi:hypothetical protein